MLIETFSSLSAQLSDNGYPIIPVIANEKRPALRSWPEYVYSKTDSVKYENCGIGILTGQARLGCYSIAAVDIDITDSRLSEDISSEILSRFGEGLVRVGKAPKSLIIYRAAVPGIRKYQSAQYAHGRIEILGNGQQFVAFGVHPDTKAAYNYTGILGSPEHVKAFDLPVLSESDIRGIIGLYESLMDVAGFVAFSVSAVPVAPVAEISALDVLAAPKGITLEQAAEYLSFIIPGDRQVWLNAGMALHHEFSGSPEALNLWDTWSAKSSKYVTGEPVYLWASFGKHTGSRREITAGWLIKSAGVIKAAQEKSAKSAEYELLLSDIGNCADKSALLGQIAPRVSSEKYDTADRVVLVNTIRSKFKALTGAYISLKETESAIAAPFGQGSKYEFTEVGNASRMVDKYGQDLIYVPESAQWYRWTGTRWSVCVREIVLRAAEKAVDSILTEVENASNPKAEKAIRSWHKASQKISMFSNIAELAQMNKKILRHADTLDCDTNYLGVLNGAIYLKTGDLISPDKNLCLTLNTGIEYDPEAQAPVFKQTLQDIFFNDTALCDFLQRLVGYSLLGHPEREEIVVLPEGRGANGKSTIFNAIHHALGTYSRYVSADTFCNSKTASSASGAREDVLRLQGARFCYVTELEENGVMRESFIKSMTGGESIPARGLYSRHTVEIRPTWIAFMPTNHLPIIKGEDKGIWRKICVLPFHRDFTADKTITKDPNRKAALLAEASGILKWAIAGCLEYQRIGLSIPESIRAASEDYKSEMDLLSDWLTSSCECDPSYTESNENLWANWQDFAKAQGLLNLISSANALSRRLVHRGFARVKNTGGVAGRGFRGLQLKGGSGF